MPILVYLLRKPSRGPAIQATAEHGTGAMNVRAITPRSGSWPPNVVLEHLPDCEPGMCEHGCPARALAEQAGTRAPSRFLTLGALAPKAEKPPWMV